MERVRALTGSSRMPSRTYPLGTLLRNTFALLLSLGLLAPAVPALAEAVTSPEAIERLAAELDDQVSEADAQGTPTAEGTEVETMDIARTMAALPQGTTHVIEVDPDETVSFDLTVDADDLVGIRASASGSTSDSNGAVGTYVLKRGDVKLDTVTLLKDTTEDSWFPLTAGTYTVEFTSTGTTSARRFSLYWAAQKLDLEGGQLTLPNNREFDTALPVDVNKAIHGVFYWGFNASNPESKLDGHYYQFKVSTRSAVTLVLGAPGTSQVAIMNAEGKVIEGGGGDPCAASGSGSTSVDCGTLEPGTYCLFVVSSDPASWRQHYVAEVFAHPLESQLSTSRNVYRLYNKWSGEHLFTADLAERDANVRAGWNDEGIAWVAPIAGVPVWRLSNPYTGEYLYTMSASEQSALLAAGWRDEGTAWYSDGSEGEPVYRLYNPQAKAVGSHHYTTDSNEYATLARQGWRQEGTCWHGLR